MKILLNILRTVGSIVLSMAILIIGAIIPTFLNIYIKNEILGVIVLNILKIIII